MDRSTNTLPNEELEQFMNALSNYNPAIPDQLIRHYLSRAGFSTNDVRVERLVALAAQKFLADVSNDALAHSRLRQNTTPATSKKASANRDTKLTLTVDDLERALRDYGVNLCKPPYFADSVSAGAPEPTTSGPTNASTNPSGKPPLQGQPQQQQFQQGQQPSSQQATPQQQPSQTHQQGMQKSGYK